MKIIDGLKLIGRPAEIPDCSRDDLPQFFVEMGYKAGAEIGVAKGEFSEKFAKAGLKLYAIDPWREYRDFKHSRGQTRLDSQFEHTKRVLAPYAKCKIIRKTSMEAAEDFEDGSLDFVYIDANHGFRYIAEDLWEWSKKVRKGGVISGHDYAISKDAHDKYSYHVKFAVDGFIRAKEILTFYVLGRKETLPDEKRDKWRSWMWIKK
jgi:hypothetical protein